MPAKIQKTYHSLIKTLDLNQPPDQFELLPDVRGVVVLHEHCEGDIQSDNGGFAGISAGGDMFPPLVLPRAGSYQITAYVYMRLAIALVGTTEVVVCSLRRAGGGGAKSILRWDHGDVTPLVSTVTIPKLHVEDGMEIVLRLATPILLNDQAYGLLTVQPV